jgi:flavin-dependent dehydrogenase
MFGECLPPLANALLERLQLSAPDPHHHLPCYGNESAWGQSEIRSSDFIFNPYGKGWHLDRNCFDQSLRAAARARGVEFVDRPHAARWVIDCTGRGSAVACKRGARLLGQDRLVAFAATACLETCADADSTTLTESVPDGWWYTARLSGRRRVITFHTDGDLTTCQSARDRRGFLGLLERTRHIRKRLSSYSIPEGFPVALPAGGRWLTQAYGEGWVAVGDAAQCYDPLSSQGLMHALEGGMRAAFAVHASLNGDDRHLRRYQTLLELERLRYERLRRQVYGLERRWTESTFWRRRHAPGV